MTAIIAPQPNASTSSTAATSANSTLPVRKKRAAVVCVACHSRKIKCDLKTRSDAGHSECSNCLSTQQTCEVRASRRGKRQRTSAEPGDSGATSELPVDAGEYVPSISTLPSSSLTRASSEIRTSHFSNGSSSRAPAEYQNTGFLTEGDISAIVNNTVSSAASDLLSISSLPKLDSNISLPSMNTLLPVPTPYGQPSLNFPIGAHGQGQNTSTFTKSASVGVEPRSEGPAQSYTTGDVDTGYQAMYSVEHARLAAQEELNTSIGQYFKNNRNPIQEDLQESFIETYFEYCYAFCPVLDSASLHNEMRESVLLANAVALAASHIRPPLMAHEGPATYYDRARNAFYCDEEPDGLTALKALCLFNWWAPRGPSTVHRHSSWWWQSVIIRHAQQANFHREPPLGHPSREKLNLSLRRRIWWTAFARERLTALCQSKPCIIDPSDCNIAEPQPSDFPEDAASQRRGRIFLHWVRLCGIIGRVAKRLWNANGASLSDLQMSLVEWIQALPADLTLPIASGRTTTFDRDIHQLYLPYLTTIIVLNLKRSASDLPDALPPAIVAASCTVRILRDVLARGDARFLMPITCWYTGMAFIPLLQAVRMPGLADEANNFLDVLLGTCLELEKMWGSAAVIRAGCERMRRESTAHQSGSNGSNRVHGTFTGDLDEFDWSALFPFVSRATNKTIASLLDDKANGSITRGLPSPTNMDFYDSITDFFFLDPFANVDTFPDDQPIDFGLQLGSSM